MAYFAIFIAEGFEETEALGTIDILRRAGAIVDIVSMTDDLLVSGSHGIKIMCDKFLESLDHSSLDGLILPGGLPGVENLSKNVKLLSLIKKFNSDGKLICAICAAPSILAELGLLTNCNATVYPGFEVVDKDVNYTSRGVEISGNIITSKGLGYVFDFALEIVKMSIGHEVAESIAFAIQKP